MTCWDLLAQKWNDEDFEPTTEADSSLHCDFSESFTIEHSRISDLDPLDAQGAQTRFAKMVLEMNRCIQCWERSRQGEGGVINGGKASTIEQVC